MTDTASEANARTETASVLVVEDNKELADLYAAWLTNTYAVQTAYTGEKALEKLDEAVDVVLLDRRMPSISGDDVLEEVRNQHLDCRVVIVSAVTPDFDIIGMGFDDYLTKPVDSDDLHDAVERMLARTEYNEKMQEYQQLVATRATLEAEKSEHERLASDEYADLQDRIAELETAVDSSLAKFTDEDYEAAFRDFDQTSDNNPSETDTPDGKQREEPD